MARKRISQREAWQLRRRVRELALAESTRRGAWVSDWPDGTHLGDVELVETHHMPSKILTARKLKHAVVVTVDGQRMRFYALPLAQEARSK